MQFDRGYLSPNFVTDADEMKVELDKCLVLIHEDKIESVKTLVPLLEKVMEAKKPLLIIAEDITGEALSRWSSTSSAARCRSRRSRPRATATAARRCCRTSRS
jgi:chaperonin GroEL (HSP60 family)